MGYELTDFLVRLGDPALLREFFRKPDTVMEASGLSEAAKRAVGNGDTYAIRYLCAHEMSKDSLHARLLLRSYAEHEAKVGVSARGDLHIALAVDANADLDADVDSDLVHNHDNGVESTDLGDDIAEFSPRYSFAHYYDHLFDGYGEPTQKNELVFIGTGIDGANHLTAEGAAHIASADKVLYCVADLVIERRLQTLNDCVEDLYFLYGDDKPRRKTYEEMVEKILAALREHERVCAVFYGHPGIFVWPSHKAIQISRREGYKSYMLPAVSSLDCLFADVGFDPSRHSCQILEATDLLVRSRQPDTSAAVVIFQVGCVGDLGFNTRGYDRRNVPVLAEYLASHYGEEYEVILYEAAQYPVCSPKIKRLPISDLVNAKPSGITTLYIPPKSLPRVDRAMLSRLGLAVPSFREPNAGDSII
jgi:precorrin-2 methylase